MTESKIIKNIDLSNNKEGDERRNEIYTDLLADGAIFPKPVGYKEIDISFIKFVKEELEVNYELLNSELNTSDVKRVPVYNYFNLNRSYDFMQAWKNSDLFKEKELPFITVTRSPAPKEGTMQNGYWNIPTKKPYTVYKIPSINNGVETFDLYKIPQPIAIDIEYKIRIFAIDIRLINDFNSKILKKFSARQAYVFPNNHPMAMLLDDISDSTNYDINERKFYVQEFTINLTGYILPEEDFQITPAVSRARISFNIIDVSSTKKKETISCLKIMDYNDDNTIYGNLAFKNGNTKIKIYFTKNTTISEITNAYNIPSYKLLVNNNENNTLPLSLNKGDILTINITKEYPQNSSGFILKGTY